MRWRQELGERSDVVKSSEVLAKLAVLQAQQAGGRPVVPVADMIEEFGIPLSDLGEALRQRWLDSPL
jgi:hypothetical protein